MRVVQAPWTCSLVETSALSRLLCLGGNLLDCVLKHCHHQLGELTSILKVATDRINHFSIYFDELNLSSVHHATNDE